MPYKLSGNCVVKDDGSAVPGGCHKTHEEAVAHLRALYANVPDAKKEAKDWGLTDDQASEAGTIRTLLVSKVHHAYTTACDQLSMRGYLSQENRKKITDAFGMALKTLNEQLDPDVAKILVEDDDLSDIASKEAGDTPSENYAHGPGGILSQPGQGMTKKKKKGMDMSAMLNAMIGVKESSGESAGTSGHGGYLVTDGSGNKHLPTSSNGKRDHRLMAAARAALTSNYRGHSYQGPNKEAAIAKLKRMYEAEGMDWGEKETDIDSQFVIEKDANGEVRWVLFSGSAFEDKDLEIISQKAFERDCDEMELTGDYGELLWWHCDGQLHPKEKEARPYLPLGKCDLSLMQDKINIESGTFYDEEIGLALLENAKELGASKAFYHSEDEPQDGVYYTIRTKERSLMPRARESNLLTRLFNWSKEKEMADNAERVDALKKKIGAEKTQELLDAAKELSQRAETFLASKEKKPKDDEAAEAKPDDEQAEGENMDAMHKKMKEHDDAFVTFKEQSDKVQLTLKETQDKLAKLELTLKETQDELAKANRLVAALYGIQPKGNGYHASTAKETEVVDLGDVEKLARQSAKAAGEAHEPDEWLSSIAGFVITGNK